jgi:hypothetical protein
VNFGEPVAGFDAADVTVGNGSVTTGSFQDTCNGTFTFTVDPSGSPVTVSVDIAAGGTTGITDVAGNLSLASTQVTRDFDNSGL